MESYEVTSSYCENPNYSFRMHVGLEAIRLGFDLHLPFLVTILCK